ncbi:MAG: penicillin acylase family protein, partial [Candidatus Krumholzibacteriales bacterium]
MRERPVVSRRIKITVLIILSGTAGLAALILLAFALALRGSLPRLAGERRVEGLISEVTVTRDSLGVVDIQAENRLDAAFALGYLHAQDRFFQMDLQRRNAAGELAELLGPALLSTDRAYRIHRFRKISQKLIEGLSRERRKLLDAYTAGVNSGMDDLKVRPFEYLILRRKPEPWLAEDTILTIYTMFLDLSLFTYRFEYSCSLADELLPAPLADYLLTRAARWDAPLRDGPPYPSPVPDSTMVDLRKWETAECSTGKSIFTKSSGTPGSNNWAVAGKLTSHGGALLANDMHLSHGIPNIWYRARISWNDDDSGRSLTGVTLPGIPTLITGSNGDIAWGFTNSYVDAADLVRLEVNRSDSTLYRTPDGWEKFRTIREVIEAGGGEADTLLIRQTRWGPVRLEDAAGNPMALRWTAHDTAAVNMNLLELETARNVDEAVAAASRAGIPPQNFVCADRAGDIAWTIAGRIPNRFGWDGRLPVSWADGSCGWNGYLSPEQQPAIVRPPGGLLWTANNRVAGGEFLKKMGDG